MANYRPLTKVMASGIDTSGVMIAFNISTSAWAMALLKGTALTPTGAPIASGAVAIWEGTNPTSSTADHTTFTDSQGRYGITVKAKTQLKLKFYGK